MQTHIIQVPYDSGRRNARMGNGPGHLVAHARPELTDAILEIIQVEELSFELGTTLHVLNAISERVSAANRKGAFPIVLAGGCISSVGTVAGMNTENIGIIWLDAHADFNTPETTLSGFIDGMALAMATGRCWRNLTGAITGFQPVREKDVILIGARDLDPPERRLLDSSEITRIETETIRRQGVRKAMQSALRRFDLAHVYLHIDLDVLDRSEARVNEYSSPGGLRLSELLEIVHVIADDRSIGTAAITAYDPSCDRDGKGLRAATVLLKDLKAARCIDAN